MEPNGRTTMGHGATLKARAELQPVVAHVINGVRITLEDLRMTGPTQCVNPPASSQLTPRRTATMQR
ncbi:hypothetical protein ACIQVR_37270 [Streptomyces xanthochromogenes]|uniref:hypothetical protein n=1 Tax=Streptomyces xanthochromogenes TaxID=67384 RepID=UPI0038171E95